ncbi:MAG: Cof-type HAD-IIB family hydrolase [Bacillota bacterium]
MMMQKKVVRLVVVDLDGTLLDRSKVLRDDVKATVARLRRAGVRFSIATGRTFPSAARYARELGLFEPIVAGSGAVIKSALTGEELGCLVLPRDVATRVLEETRGLGVPTYVFTGERILADRPSSFSPLYARSLGHPIELSRDILREDLEEPVMIVLRTTLARTKEIREEMARRFGNTVCVTSSAPFFVDFLHPMASKAAGVEAVARHLGIPRESVMAVGDGLNDMGMLKYAGIGVLVSNAPEDLWPGADYVTREPFTDGVLEAIRLFVEEA